MSRGFKLSQLWRPEQQRKVKRDVLNIITICWASRQCVTPRHAMHAEAYEAVALCTHYAPMMLYDQKPSLLVYTWYSQVCKPLTTGRKHGLLYTCNFMWTISIQRVMNVLLSADIQQIVQDSETDTKHDPRSKPQFSFLITNRGFINFWSKRLAMVE